MRLKLTLGDGPGERDVLVTADGTATVGAVAEHLAAVTGHRADAALTVRTHGVPSAARPEPPEVLDPAAPLAESPLRSGTKITLCPASSHFAPDAGRGDAAARLRVVEGPDTGREFDLPFGSSYVGREAGCDVPLRDGYVSKRHLRVSISDAIEVVDLGSANGITVGGEAIQRAVVKPEDRIGLGDSVLTIAPLVRFRAQAHAGLAFNRRPWVSQAHEGRELTMPEPSTAARAMRFPLLAVMAPLVLGAVMFAVTGSRTTIVFVALSPLLMLGSFADQWRQRRAENKAARREFAEQVSLVREELTEEHRLEQASRLVENPSTAEVAAGVEELGALLWSRRPDMPGFLQVRLGTGPTESRSTVKMPERRRIPAGDWQELVAVRDDFRDVADVPIVADLSLAGGVGVAGPERVMAGVARAMEEQLAGLHSPAEHGIVAVGSSSSSAGWEWLKWLPHVNSAHGPIGEGGLANNAAAALRLVSSVEELITGRAARNGDLGASGPPRSGPPALLVVVLDDAPVERSRLVQIAEHGPAVGVHVLWCSGSLAQIPAACRAYVDLPAEGLGTAGLVHRNEAVAQVVCDHVDDHVAVHVARRLSPLVDAGARIEDSSDLPKSASYLGTLGKELGSSHESVLERWHTNDPTLQPGGKPRKEPLSLRAVVGTGNAADRMALDLRVHGPHALVGGTTGSGKSEFLQTWVLGMAASQSPKRVTFLFVDYKGGSAFAACTQLPHCVGLVTDLSEHLVRRALTSLRAELTYREKHLRTYGAKDLVELERDPQAEQLPSLIIVVDEFAALVKEVPDFIEGVMDVAQRGRSLGLHLILATQRPSGVITGSLKANTNLRVALRVADTEDSTDVIGAPLAADFDPAVPGRAAAKTGPGRLSVFQSLYVGGVTSEEPTRAEIAAETFGFGVGGELVAPVPAAQAVHRPQGEQPTDLQRMVVQMKAAQRQLELPEPRRPWMEVLAPVYDWSLLGQRRDSALAMGVLDVPKEQSTRTACFYPDEDGNMAIFGTGGSGKSTLLRTIATAAAVSPRGGLCDVYCLDFGSRGLAMLEDYAHVGAVINGSDHERVGRLLRWLRDEVERRSARFAAAKASNIEEYRATPGDHDERRILVLVDGFSSFREEYEIGPRSAWYASFGQLAAAGRGVGIHFVLTADRPTAVPPSLSATIQRRVVLRLSDPNEYAMAGVPSDILNAESPPGRGILDGLEFQVAVRGASPSLPQQAEAAASLQGRLEREGRPPARPIERLSDRVLLADLPVGDRDRVVIGLGDETLAPFGIEPSGFFLIAGPARSGRTTAVVTLTRAVLRARPALPAYLFGANRSALRGMEEWSGVATDEEAIRALAAELDERTRAGEFDHSGALIAIEGLHQTIGSFYEDVLESLMKLAVEHGLLVIGEGDTSPIANAFSGPANQFRQGRRGLVLQPEDQDGAVFKMTFPRLVRSEFPQGRGVVVDAGVLSRVQVCLPE